MTRRVLIFVLVLFVFAPIPNARAIQPDLQKAEPPPDKTPLEQEFEKRGLRLGAPVFLRIFKQQSLIELWVSRGSRYVRFKTYPVCDYSGVLGPKLLEGDYQAPEGLYYIRSSDMIVNLRWHRAMDLNFPNSYDLVNGRTGSGILIHGKCSSVGCFALTDDKVEELYAVVEAALNDGQARVPVLSLPFPMTRENIEAHKGVEWMPFWRELKRAYDLFERDRLPPAALLCGTRYHFIDRRRHGLTRKPLPANCKPLSKPAPPSLVASARRRKPELIPVIAGLTPKQAALQRAKTCNPNELSCRLLKRALESNVSCPKKYARCRREEAAITKSIDCPLKYPRCRGRGGARKTAKPRSRARLVQAR